jgi:hypothetical protein
MNKEVEEEVPIESRKGHKKNTRQSTEKFDLGVDTIT